LDLLIDGDVLLYKFAYRNEYSIEWDQECTSEILDGEQAIAELDQYIHWLLAKTETNKELVFLSSIKNWRNDVLPSYKHNRTKPKPTLHKLLKYHLRNNFQTLSMNTLEADDLLGIYATLLPGKYIVATIDKDLLQIPGKHYNWNHDEFKEITELEGDYQFYLQAVIGDSTDGYSGIPGIGPKKAEKMLEPYFTELKECPEDSVRIRRNLWQRILEEYEKKGMSEEEALQQARVARICRADDYDWVKKQVILWSP
jgi:DNA polymerase I